MKAKAKWERTMFDTPPLFYMCMQLDIAETTANICQTESSCAYTFLALAVNYIVS